jgi:hypothetical protein
MTATATTTITMTAMPALAPVVSSASDPEVPPAMALLGGCDVGAAEGDRVTPLTDTVRVADAVRVPLVAAGVRLAVGDSDTSQFTQSGLGDADGDPTTASPDAVGDADDPELAVADGGSADGERETLGDAGGPALSTDSVASNDRSGDAGEFWNTMTVSALVPSTSESQPQYMGVPKTFSVAALSRATSANVVDERARPSRTLSRRLLSTPFTHATAPSVTAPAA